VLTLTALDLPPGANFSDNGNNIGNLSWSPSTPGQYNIRLRASDGSSTTTTLGIITVFPASDTDGDGMDDAWEMATFGSLDEDADGDFDGDGISNIDEYLLWVANGNNFSPVAADDIVFGIADSPVGIAALGNDTDGDPGETLTIDSVTPATNGSVTISADAQTLSYLPNPGFTGIDTFDYTISDGSDQDTATVTITILAHVETPYTYHVLNPAQASAPAQVVSLVNGNTITAGATTLVLDRYEVGQIPAVDLPQGGAVSGSGPFEVAGTPDGSDMLVPDIFSATDFVVPLVRDSHKLYLLSPIAAANVEITVDGVPAAVLLTAGLVAQYNIPDGSTGAATITSDQPILVLHTGFDGVNVSDVYPLPPPVNRGWGLRSADAVVGALLDNTTIHAYADDGSSESFTLDAGEQQALSAGINDANGQGSAFHLVADQPILATQHGDEGDGSVFFSSARFANRFALPLDTQYLAVICAQPGTQVTVDDGVTPQTLICNSDGVQPGKVYFGSPLSGIQFAAGTSVVADKPVMVVYESSPIADEHNLLGSRWSNALVQITSPVDQFSNEGDSVNLNIVATDTDNDPLTYAAAGLPPGLGIDASGLISGVLDFTSAGSYVVNVTVDDGIEPVDTEFNWDVANANQLPLGLPVITGIPTQGQSLVADTTGIGDADGLDTFAYQWQADGVDIGGATNSTYLLTQSESGSNITLVVSYTDGGGTPESLTSAGFGPVVNVNDAPQGTPGIDGTLEQNQVLTANTSGISDTDGLGSFLYQWRSDSVDIAGAVNASYTLTQNEVDSTITVIVSYVDGEGTLEDIISTAVGPVVNINDAPVGLPVITGSPSQNQILSVDTTGINDADGLGAYAYQWRANGADISGANAVSYAPTQAEVGSTITVVVGYTDGGGSGESLISAGVGPVTDSNDPPLGLPLITGTPTEGFALTADTAGITDADGLGTFTYQWRAEGVDIAGETTASLELTQDQVGSQISVVVSYTDDGGTSETLVAEAVGPIANVNQVALGTPTINGTPTQGQLLSVDTAAISDIDGLGPFSYQWRANGTDIPLATGTSLTLTQNEVGLLLDVIVSYVDGGGTLESVSSLAVSIANANDLPLGKPVLNGVAIEDQAVVVDNSGITDLDGGVGPFSHRWYGDGAIINGATNGSYDFTQLDVGKMIHVESSYTDAFGTLEVIASDPVGPVANIDDLPLGQPVIDGTLSEGQTLVANVSGISDEDGLGTFGYQWFDSGDTPISGASSASYVSTQADVGTSIYVIVAYTDGFGMATNIASAAVGPIENINDVPVGLPLINGTATQGQILTADTAGISDVDGLGVFAYQWQADAADIVGATGPSFTLTQAEVSRTITVIASYTDGGGSGESLVSASVGPVANVNDAPTGLPVISGIPTQGQTLNADTAGIDDVDGLGAFSYQWQADGLNASGADSASLELSQAEVGSTITVTVSYTDLGGTSETVTSIGVGPVINVNDAPAGLPGIEGTATQNQTLSANTTGISDADGLNAFAYQWRAEGIDIGGANAVSYVLTQSEVGATITLEVGYTDGGGFSESLVSAGVGPIANINDAPAGVPVISGFIAQNQVLTAITGTISDADGLGTFSYQWQADGLDIAGANSVGYALTQSEVGATITVVVSYLDNGGTTESVTSSAVGPVSNVNDAPSGLPVINGIPTQGQTLNADTAGINDVDGLGAFNYQWQADDLDIIGAIDASLALTQAEVGSTISVIIRYTDGGGVLEVLASTAVGPVSNINDVPTGLPVINGIPTQGQTLNADTTGISDADGLNSFAYQWQADDADISGANSVSYTPTQAEVGSNIALVVSYTDGGGTNESLTSTGVGPVANINDVPVGLPVIDGSAAQAQVLSVNTTSISDADGLGTFSYQWQADGLDISGANGASVTLTQTEVGSSITVIVGYSDGGGTSESLTSASIGPVANVNDVPTGLPVINGIPTQDQNLTVDTAGISDVDGLAAFDYQWQADGLDISGANDASVTLTQTEVGSSITVIVGYTDGGGTSESLTSASIGPVANVNDVPTGLPVINGIPTQGQTLTADTRLPVAGRRTRYQWRQQRRRDADASRSWQQHNRYCRLHRWRWHE